MTTLATTLEEFWDDSDLNVISEPQSPFEISTLESLVDSDTSEYELEEVSLFVQEAQDHIACALKESLESAVHEALAKYSVTHTKESNNNNEPNHVSEISEFWNGWSMDIKIDEEINSLDEIYSIQEEIAKIQAHKNVSKPQLLPQLILPSPSSVATTTNSAQTLSTQVLNTVSTLPSPSLEVSFVSSTSRNPNPTALEIISLEKSTKTKKRTNKPTTIKQNTKKTKTKKRKINDIITTTVTTATPPPHEDVSTNYIAPKKVYSKQNLRKKSSLRSSTALKEVFKLEEVLKIKSVDQDCEDEEVDIGDYSTDYINL
jgi:hypothetical protein